MNEKLLKPLFFVGFFTLFFCIIYFFLVESLLFAALGALFLLVLIK